jgi:hypothetical protein
LETEPQLAFISYCRIDSEFVLRLAEDLKAAGARVWMDQLDIVPGEKWDVEVEQALTNCAQMLVILSPVSAVSTNVRDEIAFALNNGKKIIPVLYQDCKIPLRLQSNHYVDFRTDYARGLSGLVKTLERAARNASDRERGPAIEQVAKAAHELEQKLAAEKARLEEERPKVAEQARLEAERQQTAERSAAEAGQGKNDRPIQGSKRSHWKSYLIALLLVAAAIGASSYWFSRPRPPVTPPGGWKAVPWNYPALSNCLGVKECIEIKAQADLVTTPRDWEHIRYDDQILSNCMSFQPCVARRDQAERILAAAFKGWGTVTDPQVLNDCMQNTECLKRAKDIKAPTIPRTVTPAGPTADNCLNLCDDPNYPRSMRQEVEKCKANGYPLREDCNGMFKNQ